MSEFFYGVIEGFYGRPWPWRARLNTVDYLSKKGFACYIYAPKSDDYLRSSWMKPWPTLEFSRLQQLSQRCHEQGVDFGVGLTPLNLSQHYDAEQQVLLKSKLEQINQLKVDTLCILFDDMRGDCPDLAERQLVIINDVLESSAASKHIVCPSYYSFDPVLEEVFGEMPVAYLETLGEKLPADIGIFWTGNQVISSAYTEQDIARATTLLNRKPVIWDNYPVNDGRLTSQFLHLRPYSGRPRQINQWASGHIVNPMNQPALSRWVLSSLAQLYQSNEEYNADAVLLNSLAEMPDSVLSRLLKRDVELFSEKGLQEINRRQRELLIEEYSQLSCEIADEIVSWLREEYRFDPECLTE